MFSSCSPDVKRDPVTQRYDDEYLAGVLQRATSVHAGAFRVIDHLHQIIDLHANIEIKHHFIGKRYRTYVGLKTRRIC